MTNYSKTMAESLVEVHKIAEATMKDSQIAQLKKAYEPMRGKKISISNGQKLSKMMDKFDDNKQLMIQLVKADIPFVSSLAVTRLISKHNMKGAEINKLKKEEMEFWESLEEHKGDKPHKHPHDEDELDEDAILNLEIKIEKLEKKKKLTPKESTLLTTMKAKLHKLRNEELDEGTKQVLAHGGKGQYKVVKDGDITKVMYKGKVVGTADFDRGADSFFVSIKGEKGQKSFDDAQAIADYFAKNKIKEEVELDEKTKWKMGDGRPRGAAYLENERFWNLDKDALLYIMKDADKAMKANPTGRKAGKYADEVNDAHTVLGWRKKNGIKEEVELDEALPSHLKKHFDKDGNPKSKEGKAAWERLAKMKGFKKYTSQQIKMAIGIAFDKRYVQGNMTGAVNAIEKIAKGLSEIEPVANALRRANEEVVKEGTWAVPETSKQKSALKKLLSKPLKAKGATDKLYNIIGDDELFDNIDDFASTEPNADVRSMVRTAMKRLGIKEETILDRIDIKLKEIKNG